jgi:hypothetical protein
MNIFDCWMCWVVPVIGVVLAIVGVMLRNMAQAQEEQQRMQRDREKRAQRPLAPPRPEGTPPPRRPAPAPGSTGVTELDRFLQEVQRRKQGASAKPAEPPPVAKPVEPRPRPSVSPPPTAVRPAGDQLPAPRPRPRPPEQPPAPRPRPQPSRPESPKTVILVEEPVPVVEVVEERHPTWQPRTRDAAPAGVPRTAEQAYKTSSAPATRTQAAESPVAAQLRSLLRTRQSLATAVVLSEIFGPPKCQRGRR